MQHDHFALTRGELSKGRVKTPLIVVSLERGVGSPSCRVDGFGYRACLTPGFATAQFVSGEIEGNRIEPTSKASFGIEILSCSVELEKALLNNVVCFGFVVNHAEGGAVDRLGIALKKTSKGVFIALTISDHELFIAELTVFHRILSSVLDHRRWHVTVSLVPRTG